MAERKTIEVKETEIRILTKKDQDYISLTDIAKSFPTGSFSCQDGFVTKVL